MFIHKSKIFSQFPEIIFGLSTKIGNNNSDKFSFNMSKSIGDDENIVQQNRSDFFTGLGLSLETVVTQKQIHSATINYVEKFTNNLVGDALITKTLNLGLAASTADCTNIYLYDPAEKIIGAVHSGWGGTEKRILEKTVQKLISEFSTNPKNLFVYIGPSISRKNYEVGKEFDQKFDEKYLTQIGDKYLLDLKLSNKDMLLNLGIPESQIEISEICNFENEKFHSYRRDKEYSGRAFGVIALKGKNE
jgi:polyphenol oxidase